MISGRALGNAKNFSLNTRFSSGDQGRSRSSAASAAAGSGTSALVVSKRCHARSCGHSSCGGTCAPARGRVGRVVSAAAPRTARQGTFGRPALHP